MTKIELLVDTIVNGNNISKSEYYSKLLKSVKIADFRSYCQFTYGLKVHGSKLEILEQVKEYFDNRRTEG